MSKVRVLFVCHGNICRSPMAEFILREQARRRGLGDEFAVSSCGTSSEEVGNDVHPDVRRVLGINGIPYGKRSARQLVPSDYGENDMIVAMDSETFRSARHILGGDPDHKLSLLMEHAGENREVADPWYTGDFLQTYLDVTKGCLGIIDEVWKTL